MVGCAPSQVSDEGYENVCPGYPWTRSLSRAVSSTRQDSCHERNMFQNRRNFSFKSLPLWTHCHPPPPPSFPPPPRAPIITTHWKAFPMEREAQSLPSQVQRTQGQGEGNLGPDDSMDCLPVHENNRHCLRGLALSKMQWEDQNVFGDSGGWRGFLVTNKKKLRHREVE